MPHRTFILFIFPSMLTMILFIALPIISIAFQSLFVQHRQVMEVVETCDPFRCIEETRINAEAMAALYEEAPAGRFVGLGTYVDTGHLAFAEIGELWRSTEDFGAFFSGVFNLPFYDALVFTLAYTVVVTPISLLLAFLIALAVNVVPRLLHGVIIYFSSLPFIVPSLLGSLILFWMLDARGVIGSSLQVMFNDPDLSVKASPTLTWIAIFVYGIWGNASFFFIILYAGLQTVPRDSLESAMIDGASRFERVRFVVIPHMRPILIFLALVGIMDNFRVFEAIIGLNAGAYANSLSTLVFNALRSGETPLFGSAAATSLLTIFCIAILMMPSMYRSWVNFKQKA